MNQTIDISTEGGQFSAYVARPAKIPAPAVIVLHEVFGVNEDVRKTCRELADEGFKTAKGVKFKGEPKQQPYGIEAIFMDDSGNWFSLGQK